jgi:hypothetical protein
MSPEDLLAKNGISLESTAPGQYQTTCPRCSAQRSTAGHRRAKVLSVKIDDTGVCWHCNHCSWAGPEQGGNGVKPELVTYIYRDRDGAVLFRKVRNLPGREPKFWMEKPDGRGGWVKGTPQCRYKDHLPRRRDRQGDPLRPHRLCGRRRERRRHPFAPRLRRDLQRAWRQRAG